LQILNFLTDIFVKGGDQISKPVLACNFDCNTKFEILTEFLLKIKVLQDVTPCRMVKKETVF